MIIHPNKLLDMELAVMAAERLVLVGFDPRQSDALREMLEILKEQDAQSARGVKGEAHNEIAESVGGLREAFEERVESLREALGVPKAEEDEDGAGNAVDQFKSAADTAIKQFETALVGEIDDAEAALRKFFCE
jgi:hypothetical protein